MIRKTIYLCIVLGGLFWQGGLFENTVVVHAVLLETTTPIPTKVVGAHLSLEKTAENRLISDLNENGTIDPGDTIRYTIIFRNSGHEIVTGVILVDDYDESAIIRIENISPTGLDDGFTLQWKFNELAPGEERRVIYDAVIKGLFPPDGSLEISNVATITSDQTEQLTSSHSIEVEVPKLGISKTRMLLGDLNSNDQPDPGDTLLYTITVTNLGTVDARDITLTDDYDEILFEQPLDIMLQGVNDGDLIKWHFALLQPGAQVEVSYETTLNINFPIGTSVIENAASISGTGFSNKAAQDSFEIENQPTPTSTVVSTEVPQSLAAGTSEGIEFEGIHLIYLVGLLILGGFLLLLVLSFSSKFTKDNVPDLIRDGFIITLVVGAVLTLALAGAIEHSAATGILGTVAGYLLKSVKT